MQPEDLQWSTCDANPFNQPLHARLTEGLVIHAWSDHWCVSSYRSDYNEGFMPHDVCSLHAPDNTPLVRCSKYDTWHSVLIAIEKAEQASLVALQEALSAPED